MNNPVYQCPLCGSQKIQQKAWVDINKYNHKKAFNQIELIDSTDAEDFYCNGCESHIVPEEVDEI